MKNIIRNLLVIIVSATLVCPVPANGEDTNSPPGGHVRFRFTFDKEYGTRSQVDWKGKSQFCQLRGQPGKSPEPEPVKIVEGGKFGGALECVTDWGYGALEGFQSLLDMGNECSLSAWVKWHGPTRVEGARHYIFSSHMDTWLAVSPLGVLQGYVKTDQGELYVASARRLQKDVWVHVGMTFAGQSLKLWQNGAVVGETKAEENRVLAWKFPHAGIGNHPGTERCQQFNGLIDELMLEDIARDFSDKQDASIGEPEAIPRPANADDIWTDDFEDKAAIFVPACYARSAQYEILLRTVSEEGVSGKRCGKAEYFFKTGGYFYLNIPLDHMIKADNAYFSCRLKLKSTGTCQLSEISVAGKPCVCLETGPDGWMLVSSEKLAGWVNSMQVNFNPVSQSSKLTILMDDLRVSRTRILAPPGAAERESLFATWDQMLADIPRLQGWIKDNDLKIAFAEGARKLTGIAERARSIRAAALDQGRFAGGMEEFGKLYWKLRWKFFVEEELKAAH